MANSTKFSLTVRHRHFAMQKQKTLARMFAYGKRRVLCHPSTQTKRGQPKGQPLFVGAGNGT